MSITVKSRTSSLGLHSLQGTLRVPRCGDTDSSWLESYRSQRKGMCHPGITSGFSWSSVGINPCQLPHWLPWGSYLVQMSGAGLCFTPPVWGPGPWLQSFLKSSGRRPWNHIGGAYFPVPATSIGYRVREWGPAAQQDVVVYILLGPPKCCGKITKPAITRLKPR
jgi:hypothetical protein